MKKAQTQGSFAPLLTFCIGALVFNPTSNAAEITLFHGVNTYHLDRSLDNADNENNNITALFYNKWFFSSFINSYSNRSHLIGYNYWYWRGEVGNLNYHYGVAIAAATGYGKELKLNIDGKVTFGASPFIGIKYKFTKKWLVGTDLLYLPTDDGGVFVTGLNATYRF